MSQLMGSSYTSQSHYVPSNLLFSRNSNPLQLSIGLQTRLDRSLSNLAQSSLLSSQSLTQSSSRPLDLIGNIVSLSGPFGSGLLVTDLQGQARVNKVDAANGDVAQSVFASILNASLVLDICHSGRGEYYFLKEDDRSFADDFQELQRLSGSYNVSSDNVRPRGRQVCAVQNERHGDRRTKICLIYGVDLRIANRHVFRASHKSATASAWIREVKSVKKGQLGSWTPSQRKELLSKGGVRGFTAVEIHNVHKVPELIGQSSNIRFVSESEVPKWHAERRRN